MPRGPNSRGSSGPSRYNFGPSRSFDPFSSWTCDPELLYDAIAAVLGNGDALLLSLTSDGGALVISVYSGNERVKAYVTGGDELEVALQTLRDSKLD